MAKRKGLPKKYAKMGFVKGWKVYKASLRSRSKASPKKANPSRRRGKTMAKKRKTYRKTATNFLTSKTAIDGYLSAGGKIVVRKVLGGGPLYEAGVDVAIGFARKNNTLLAQGLVTGLTAFLPNLNLGGGVGGTAVR